MNAPAATPFRLTQFSHGGGCGCKIAPGVLTELLAATPMRALPKDLLVGTESSDDAAVYRLNDSQALVATTDFFTPIVDDPYDFGRIAATNALSDIYAMGGYPIMALAIVGMPLDKLPVEVIQKILAGGESVCAAAGNGYAGCGAHRFAAGEDFLDHLDRQLVERHADDRQSHDRVAAHGVDVRQRVGRGDATEVVGIIDDRRKKIGGRDQRLTVVQAIHGGVVARLRAHQQVLGQGAHRRGREQLGEHAGRNLAAAAAAMGELGEAKWSSGRCIHGDGTPLK